MGQLLGARAAGRALRRGLVTTTPSYRGSGTTTSKLTLPGSRRAAAWRPLARAAVARLTELDLRADADLAVEELERKCGQLREVEEELARRVRLPEEPKVLLERDDRALEARQAAARLEQDDPLGGLGAAAAAGGGELNKVALLQVSAVAWQLVHAKLVRRAARAAAAFAVAGTLRTRLASDNAAAVAANAIDDALEPDLNGLWQSAGCEDFDPRRRLPARAPVGLKCVAYLIIKAWHLVSA